MRHAKHIKGRPKPKARAASPLADIASSLRELAQGSAAMRGAGIGRASDSGTEDVAGVLSDEGKKETIAVATRLADFPEWQEELRLGGILHAGSDEATETADAFREAFEAVLSKTNPHAPRTTPVIAQLQLKAPSLGSTAKAALFSMLAETETVDAIVTEADDILGRETGNNAVLLVGHQPAIAWLASALLGNGVPMAHSEILCLDLKGDGRPALRWTISSLSEATLQDLYDKIKSKMTLANLLGGFITAGIGLLLGTVSDEKKIAALGVQAAVVFVAAGCLVLAVGLYLLTMFSYDRLLMPSQFWAELPSGTNRPPWIVARPPSGLHWVLYQNMIRVWQWQFMPATFLAVSGLFMLWSAVFWGTWGMSHNCHWQWSATSRALSLSIPAVALLGILCAKRKDIAAGRAAGWDNFCKCSGFRMKFRYLCGPWLGSED
jgi:phosphohistidine phosphatase SixA